MFTHPLTIQLHHTDAYGILFFANQFKFCQEVFQAWLKSIGLPLAHNRGLAEFLAVVVHAESDYRKPVHVGDQLMIEYTVMVIGTTSFTNRMTMFNQEGVEVGESRITYVVIDPATSAKMEIPVELREQLALNSL